MNTIKVDQFSFKEHLTMIEQFALKDFLFKLLGRPSQGIDNFLPLEYKENVFAKMEAKEGTDLHIQDHELFRYVTLTEDNQIVIGILTSNNELLHRIIYLDEVN